MSVDTIDPQTQLSSEGAEFRAALTGGADLMGQPLELTAEQQSHLRDTFFRGMSSEDLAEALKEVQEAYRTRFLEASKDKGLHGINRMQSGESRVIVPSVREAFDETHTNKSPLDAGVREKVSRLRAEAGLKGVANMLSVPDVVLDHVRQAAPVRVYNSEANGAPVVVESLLDLGKGYTAVMRYQVGVGDQAVYDSSLVLSKS